MNVTRILFIDSRHLSVWQQGRGEARNTAEFVDSSDGHNAFAHFLAEHRQHRFRIVANLPDELYFDEKTPRLPRAELQALLTARSRRRFPEAAWHCWQTAADTDTHGCHFVLLALSKTPKLSAWLQQLSAARAAIVSLHSLPQLIPAWLRRQPAARQTQLVLSLHEDGARFTLIDAGHLRFSRLTTRANLADNHRRFSEQIARQYGLSDAPPLLISAPASATESGELPEAIAHLVSSDRTGIAPFLSLPYRYWPRAQFASPTLRHPAQLRSVAVAAWRLAAVSTLLAVLVSTAQLVQRAGVEAQQQDEQRQHAAVKQKLRTLSEQGTGTPLNSEQLQGLQREYQQLMARQQDFTDDLQRLSLALDDSPEIHLEQLIWENSGFPASTATLQIGARIIAVDSRQAGKILDQFLTRLPAPHQATLLSPPQAAGTGQHFSFAIKLLRREAA